MSRFLPDRLYLGIEPDRASLVRLGGFIKPTIEHVAEHALTEESLPTILGELLKHEARDRRLPPLAMQVTVSDRMFRGFVSTVPDGARNAQELRQAAALEFEDIFGGTASDWVVQRDLVPLSKSHACFACKRSLIDGISHAFQSVKLNGYSIVPFSVSEFNRHHQFFSKHPSWHIVADNAHLTISLRSRGDCYSSKLHFLQERLDEEIGRVLDQELLRIPPSVQLRQPLTVLLSGHAVNMPERHDAADAAIRKLAASEWPGTNSDWSRRFRLALSPVWPLCK